MFSECLNIDRGGVEFVVFTKLSMTPGVPVRDVKSSAAKMNDIKSDMNNTANNINNNNGSVLNAAPSVANDKFRVEGWLFVKGKLDSKFEVRSVL